MNDLDGDRKVDVFDLSIPSEKASYEKLLNDENVEITKEEFSYVRSGDPKISVWYTVIE